MKMILNKSIRDEKGQALILVMILLLVGGLIVTPLLSFMGTGLIAGRVFEEKAADLYAADAGVEDGIWQIKYDHLGDKFGGAYDPYDYGTPYVYPTLLDVNDRDVKVTIENIWIPLSPVDAPANPDDARVIIEGSGGDHPKLIITGSVPTASTFKIKIQYYPEVGEDLQISTLGIWLPPGFTYGPPGWDETQPDPSDLNSTGISYTLSIQSHASGQAVIWDFGSGAYFDGSTQVPPEPSFPGVGPLDYPMTGEITFPFDGPVGQSPEAVSWIDTNLNLYGGITYTWDADTKVYKVTSEAHRDITEPPNTTIDAYTAKSEIREFGGAIAGDYRAIGNSLMIQSRPYPSTRYRDILLDSSPATLSDIPEDAEVTAAYLYWSGWFEEGMETIIFEDECSNFSNWSNPASDWGISSGTFRGHHQPDAPDSHRYLTMQSSLDLSSYASGTVKVSWQQWENGYLESSDALRFQFSSDGGSSWGSLITAFSNDIGSWPQSFSYTVPDQYLTNNFMMRFYLDYFGGSGEYCYIDNIEIVESLLAADETCIFEIDGSPVYFDNGVPTQGSGEITADISQVINNLDYGNPHGYSYSSFKDVTDLVREFSQEGVAGNRPGNATYTVGSVDADEDKNDEWAYAGWSLILIYSSPETQGHQLYLYDDFLYKDHDDTFLDFDQDGDEGGTISGFLVPDPVAGEVNAAKITCFVGEGDDWYDGDYFNFNDTKLDDGTSSLNDVWNGRSIGMSAEGVDIDTFYVTWASDLLEPGDTSAQIDMWTEIDIWNLVYIIMSFRSEVTAGGTLTYLVS